MDANVLEILESGTCKKKDMPLLKSYFSDINNQVEALKITELVDNTVGILRALEIPLSFNPGDFILDESTIRLAVMMKLWDGFPGLTIFDRPVLPAEVAESGFPFVWLDLRFSETHKNKDFFWNILDRRYYIYLHYFVAGESRITPGQPIPDLWLPLRRVNDKFGLLFQDLVIDNIERECEQFSPVYGGTEILPHLVYGFSIELQIAGLKKKATPEAIIEEQDITLEVRSDGRDF